MTPRTFSGTTSREVLRKVRQFEYEKKLVSAVDGYERVGHS